MPTPRDGESRDDFIKRCVPIVVNDGTAKDGKQAVAVCQSMWERKDQNMAAENIAEGAEHTWLDASAARRHNQYRKDAIRVGNYIHPTTKQRVHVPPSRLAHWVDQFHAMKKAGINVPIKDGHKGPALGWISDMLEDGTQLDAIHNFPDEEGVTKAKRYRGVSIGVTPHYQDCHGNVFKDVIDHIALTPEPVITGQGEFIALSRDVESETPQPEADGAKGAKEELSMEWLNSELGLPADATEDQQKEAIAALKAPKQEEKPAEDAKPEMSRELALSRRETAILKLEQLRESGSITPKQYELSVENFAGTAEEPNVVCLAREGENPSQLDNLVKILKESSAATATGEKTPAQVPKGAAELSRNEDPEPESEETKLARESDEIKAAMLSRMDESKLDPKALAWLKEYNNKEAE